MNTPNRMSLYNHVNHLQKITRIIRSTLGLESAIFDLDNKLLACTDEYLEHKGKLVHAPSIQEVVTHGNAVVNKPGHMPSCKGCRFFRHCPAKVEILRSIRTGNAVLGVISLTSFSQEGHDKIVRDTDIYVNGLSIFSDWIADFAQSYGDADAFNEIQALLSSIMDLSEESILYLDAHGRVMRCNSKATKLFSFCDLHTRSAYQILSESLIGKVLSGKTVLKNRLQIGDQDLFLSAQPVYSYGKFTGALLKISHVGGTERSPDLDTKYSGQVYLDDFIGESPVILQIKEMVKKLSRSDSTILITGETGTGKSLLAKALHYNSKRSAHPFVQLNCASIPESLFESELFGYYEGAFTGAQKGGKPGWFEAADQGTLFLDEIGAMPQNLQAKLLNVLQDNTLQRLGGIRTIPFDVRVIAATNKDIETLVREKQFRADLYYRINVIPLDLPPLCERKSDIALFCSNFLKRAAKKAGKSIEGIDPEVMDLFYSYDWPGNIRELSNIIEFAINMAQGRQITIKDLPKRFLDRYRSLQKRVGTDVPIKAKALKIQAETIQTYLDKYGYDVQGKKTAARELGISLRTLYRKLATQKTDPPESTNFSA